QPVSHPQSVHVPKFGGDYPVDSFWDLQVAAQGDDNHTVVILPGVDNPTSKTALVFFFPEIAVGTEASYSISSTWPKAWRNLVTQGQDTCRLSSTAPVPRLRVEFKLHPKLPRLQLSSNWAKQGPQRHRVDEHGYNVYTLEMMDVVPMDIYVN